MLRKLLPAVAAGLLLILHAHTSSLAQTRSTAPIELSGITIEYALQGPGPGDVKWHTPPSDKPNEIPAASVRVRFRATVTNRVPGAKVRLRAVFQDVCPSPDPGKKFLSKLKHLAESDPGGVTPDTTDDEAQVIKPDGTVAIELLVHCPGCGEAECGKKCGEHRDHLGEGPHILGVTTSDVPPDDTSGLTAGARQSGTARPSTFKVNLMSVCPEHSKPRGKRPAGRRRAALRPAVIQSAPSPSAG
ncbi:MAG TPA: hypothetical protein VF591_00185 [Pyrinomonadaceae bacterium]|jgi:hypothetical protein